MFARTGELNVKAAMQTFSTECNSLKAKCVKKTHRHCLDYEQIIALYQAKDDIMGELLQELNRYFLNNKKFSCSDSALSFTSSNQASGSGSEPQP